MKINGVWTTFLFVMAYILSVFGQPVLAATNIDNQSSTGSVDSLVVAVSDLLGEDVNTINPKKAFQVARSLAYRVRAIEGAEIAGSQSAHPLLAFGIKSTPESRRACVMNVLGTNLYFDLENKFLKSLQTTTNDVEKIVAFQILSMGLSSSNAVGVIQNTLRNNLRILEDETATNQPVKSVMFWEAVSLCYLGQPDGLDIMSWALDSKTTSQAEKIIAIKALVTMQVREAMETLLQSACTLAFSEDTLVAHGTFDALHRVPEFSEMGMRAGMAQFERLKGYCLKRELTRDEQMLLNDVSFFFYGRQQHGELSLDDMKTIKRIAIDIIRIGRERESKIVVVNFAMMATDEDVQVIREFLKSKWSDVKIQAVWSVLNCSSGVRMKIVGDVMPLLDDEESKTSRIALDVIRSVKGEKPKELRSQEEFKTEVDRIKAWWNAVKR